MGLSIFSVDCSASTVEKVPATPQNTSWLVSVTPFTEEQKQIQKDILDSAETATILSEGILVGGTSVPTSPYYLPSQDTYFSSAFSGSGFRYSGYYFIRGSVGVYSGGNISVAVYEDSFDVINDSGSIVPV
ncbi:MAG: hypothetical protein LBS33_06660 [Streptococcaceae bacterium]|nr:hypothetical protein [Streptococcaceae bacterium]